MDGQVEKDGIINSSERITVVPESQEQEVSHDLNSSSSQPQPQLDHRSSTTDGIQDQHELLPELESESDTELDEFNQTNEVKVTGTTAINSINELEESIFRNIITYLNFNDLAQSRLVCYHWNKIIQKSDHFLSKAVINASIDSDNVTMINSTSAIWMNARVKYFDYDNTNVYLQPFSLPTEFCKKLVSIEFHQCDIYWPSFRRFIATTSYWLADIRITKCSIRDRNSSNPAPALSLEEEVTFNRVLTRQLRTLILSDSHNITSLTWIIRKLTDFRYMRLRKVKIEFHPQNEGIEIFDANTFSLALSDFLKRISKSLSSLTLNLRSTEILNAFCPMVLSSLEPFYEGLRLTTFKLTTPTTETAGNGAIISVNVVSSFLVFLEFLRSQAGTLKSVAFPHFTNLGTHELRRIQLVDVLNSKRLRKLRVPGHIYLRRNFLKTYVNIKVLLVGEKCGSGYWSTFNPTKFTYDSYYGRAGTTCRHIKDLSVYTKLAFDSGMLYHFLEKLPNLVHLSLDGCGSIFNDNDFQSIIKYCAKLQSLAITGCDLITDCGITGVQQISAQSMFEYFAKHSSEVPDIIHAVLFYNGGNSDLQSEFRECSLLTLTGLKSLKLIGSSKITDVSLAIGMQFRELEILHLPWSENITEYGIKKIGKYNKSLTSLTLSGATMSSLQAFSHLVTTHPRLQRKSCRVLKVHSSYNATPRPSVAAVSNELRDIRESPVFFEYQPEIAIDPGPGPESYDPLLNIDTLAAEYHQLEVNAVAHPLDHTDDDIPSTLSNGISSESSGTPIENTAVEDSEQVLDQSNPS